MSPVELPISPRHRCGQIPLVTDHNGPWQEDHLPGFEDRLVLVNEGGGANTLIIVFRPGMITSSQIVVVGPRGWDTRRDEDILTWPQLRLAIEQADPARSDPKLNELREMIARAGEGAGSA